MATVTSTMTMTDSKLREAIRDELRWEPSIDDREIGVAADDGVVTLTGTVRNFFSKWEAGSAARRVRGVNVVANDIEVVLPGDGRRSDTDIARAAGEALAWNASLPAHCVVVDVSEGQLTLGGKVPWGYQKAAAEASVRHLMGVRGVNNEITVKPEAAPTDVKANIEAAFRRGASVDAKRVRVEIEGGRVTLRGDVQTWLEREDAERSAWAAPGVTGVENLIGLTSYQE